MALKAVNGAKLKCYGFKDVTVKINRKSYNIRAIKSDVKCPILGWNFIRKYRLNLQWNDWGDICLVDPKAQSKTILHFRSMPHIQAQSMATLRLEGSEPVGE